MNSDAYIIEYNKQYWDGGQWTNDIGQAKIYYQYDENLDYGFPMNPDIKFRKINWTITT
jgi:hypothetical protein